MDIVQYRVKSLLHDVQYYLPDGIKKKSEKNQEGIIFLLIDKITTNPFL